MKHILSLFLCIITFSASGQYFGIKTNVLYDATGTINLGVETGLGKRLTLDISGNYNPWKSSDKLKTHWMVQPELRLWVCEKFNGHFFGLHGHGGHADVANISLPFGIAPGLKNSRYKGDFYGAGLAYGYNWILGPRWGLEAAIGGGYINVKYAGYSDDGVRKLTSDLTKDYWGLTKASISLIYLIR